MDTEKPNRLTVFKAYCPICHRFLFKFTENINGAIFFRCVNCKNVAAFQCKDKTLSVAIKNKDFKIEPESVIEQSELDSIYDKGRKQKI